MNTRIKAASMNQRERGFSVLEVLLALAITATAMVAMASAFHVIARSWAANTATMQRQDMLLRGLGIFARDIRGIQRLSWHVNDDKRLAFEGSNTQIQFIVVEPPFPSLPGLHFIRYRVLRDNTGTIFLRERAVYSPEIQSFSEITFVDPVRLISGPYRIRFEYDEMPDGKLSGLDRWSDGQFLPNLVRLHIDDLRTGFPVIPPLSVRPRIEAEHDCIKPGSKFCRLATVSDGTPDATSAPETASAKP